jgi:hypothetical protein
MYINATLITALTVPVGYVLQFSVQMMVWYLPHLS